LLWDVPHSSSPLIGSTLHSLESQTHVTQEQQFAFNRDFIGWYPPSPWSTLGALSLIGPGRRIRAASLPADAVFFKAGSRDRVAPVTLLGPCQGPLDPRRYENGMNTDLQASIDRQRNILKSWLSASLMHVADDCRRAWPDRQALEARLMAGLTELPYCKYLYLLDDQAHQITSNASRTGLLEAHYGRDRSERPYLAKALAGAPFTLSDAYISRNARRPSLTAVQIIRAAGGELLGYLGADFDLRELPATQALYRQPQHWMQLKGDLAIRSGLFYQQRVTSLLDQRIDVVLDLLTELITVNGVFHTKVHFSSSRATLWPVDDPYRFRIHGIDDLSNPDLCLAYPRRDYPANADIPAPAVSKVLQGFRDLRFMDETIYLRSGMLNIFNGLVGLTFSCDGSHYMPWGEFLDKNIEFWLGTSAGPTNWGLAG
jgi:hypothetical protein